MGTLLEAIGIVLEAHFRFGFPNKSAVGDSLRGLPIFVDFYYMSWSASEVATVLEQRFIIV